MTASEPADRSLPGLGRSLSRQLPALAVLVALAIWVATVPSTNSDSGVASVDIFDGATTPDGVDSFDGATTPDGNDPTGPTGGTDPSGPSAGGRASTGGSGPASGAAPGSQAPSGDDGATAAAQAGEDCSRREVLPDAECRPPAWSGDNGGATYRGVTGETINVVAYQVRQNEQVQAILNAAGTANNTNRENAFKAIVAWINDNYELYGRKLNPIFHVGTTPANDAAGQQADAVHVAEELDAAIVLTLYAAPIFSEELHRRGIPHFTWNQWARSFHDELSPHLFGLFPDRDLTFEHLAEYTCKRLIGANAVHAGDPVYQNSERQIGVVYQDETDNGPFFAKLLESKCGVKPLKMVSYPADIGNAVAIATNAVTQLKQAGVTTVTCLCDVIAPVFFTQQATNQAWFPEWIHNGFFVTDANAAGRLYDQAQWGNSFGPSSLGFPAPVAENNGFRVCRAGGAEHEDCVKGQASYYAFLAITAGALEDLGPAFTDTNFARAIVNLPASGGTQPNEPQLSFGNQGPGPWTLIDNFMEIWYDPAREGNDGKQGAAFYVESGRRHLLGQWPPKAPNVFVDDGSPQPARDPDL